MLDTLGGFGCCLFRTFKKNIAPVLQQKGWWGKKEMTGPLTGKTVNAQLESDRRLKTIYGVNVRTSAGNTSARWKANCTPISCTASAPASTTAKSMFLGTA